MMVWTSKRPSKLGDSVAGHFSVDGILFLRASSLLVIRKGSLHRLKPHSTGNMMKDHKVALICREASFPNHYPWPDVTITKALLAEVSILTERKSDESVVKFVIVPVLSVKWDALKIEPYTLRGLQFIQREKNCMSKQTRCLKNFRWSKKCILYLKKSKTERNKGVIAASFQRVKSFWLAWVVHHILSA